MTSPTPVIPDWTLGWRLQRSLNYAGISVEQMAHEFDVSRSTVSRWLNDRGTPPKRLFVERWAEMCGVPAEWLKDGEESRPGVMTPGWWSPWDGVSLRRESDRLLVGAG